MCKLNSASGEMQLGKKIFKAPTTVNLEITELCNAKCGHCYNYWRDESMGVETLTEAKFDLIIDQLVDAGVFHVILSGGEPFTKFDLLEYGFRRLQEANISVSCNSHLMLATDDKIKRLVDVGVDHVLTSLHSHIAVVNDQIFNIIGAHEKIVRGIETARRNGMRVSANMVVTRVNESHVYDTGMLAHSLGCQKIFGTRSVPPVYADSSESQEYQFTREEVMETLDQLVRVKEDTGISIGTLVSYPICMLGDLEKYQDFVGRGCPSQSGHRMSINANGNIHACVHEEDHYGNIFDSSLAEIYQQKMRLWHDGSLHYSGCDGCEFIDICESGCSMSALAASGEMSGPDPLMVGPNSVVKPYKLVHDASIFDAIRNGMRFFAPDRLRFRDEGDFYLLNIRWGDTITVPTDIAEFLIEKQSQAFSFDVEDFGSDKTDLLAHLFFKDAIESDSGNYDGLKVKTGLSINPEYLPSAAE